MNRWDLTKIYGDISLWEADLAKLLELSLQLKDFMGKLDNKETLEKYFLLDTEIDQKISKLYTYAHMNYDLNQKSNEAQSYYGRIYSTYNQISALSSFVTPEIIAIGEKKINEWIKDSVVLTERKYLLARLFRNQKHIFDAKQELLMSNYSEALGGFNNLYDQLAVADNSSTKVTISTGEELTINEGNYRSYLGTLTNQDDRRIVFEAVYKFYDTHKNTFAGIYNGIMQANKATIKNRGYEDALDLRLFGNDIPKTVYTSLINTTKTHTEPIKKYYRLRKKFFNLDKIHTYDRFLSIATCENNFDFAKCKELFFESVKRIGGEFEEYAHKALEEGRVDVDIREGKRTGAYSTGIYGVGPFILLNHSNTLDDAFTVAHESGHSMHTMMANDNQPYATADYTIFVAEIASTFNEQLLLDYLMDNIKDKNTKIVLLQQAIDGLLGTFYRQSLFADYEYQANKLVEEGKTITATELSQIMKELYLEYYDIDLNDEPYKEFVWAYIPHFFHSPFYVYQYATSFASSLAIYDAVKNKEDGAFDRYINLLKSGGSDYPVNLVKKAGVDLTTDKPFLSVVKRLTQLVDELEVVLNEQ